MVHRGAHLLYIAASLTLLPTLGLADDGEWFVAVKASLGKVSIDDISHGGTIGTGAALGGFIDGQIRDEEIDDYTGGLGFAAGKRYGNWTFEAEYIYRYRTDWDVAAPTPSISTVTNMKANVETHTLMLNLVRRGVLSQRWSWEIGAGIGLVKNAIESDYIERATPTVGEISVSDNNQELDFSYNLIAGVTRELGGAWTLNLRYRYIDLGDLSIGPFPGRPARLDAEHNSQEVQFAIEMEL